VSDLLWRPRLQRVLATATRIGVLTIGTALWWAAGLRSQGVYGLPILHFTETYQTVANAATAPEALRGLGHWYFYGRDRIGPWVQPSTTYTENLLALAISFVVPVLALAGFALGRFRHRVYFGTLIVVGTLLAVGSHPFDSPSPFGALFKAFTDTDTGLAMRSTPRALPLMILGTAVGFSAGASALGERLSSVTRSAQRGSTRWVSAHASTITAVAACALTVANLSPLWTGHAAASTLQRNEDLPTYWTDAAAALDARGNSTRVLELPGSDFAAYRWGDIVDPLTPGLIDRPYLARELVPNGSPASAALLLALDRRYQEGVAEPAALGPIARLFGVGDVVLRNDLQYERFNTPRPYEMRAALDATPGLDPAHDYGAPTRNDAVDPQPLLDAKALAEPAGTKATGPVVVYPVHDALPIVRAVSAKAPTIVAGDAEGLVDLAAAGLLDPGSALLFSASYASDPDALRRELSPGATLVVTDTNAKRGLRWGTIRDNTGYVERADEAALAKDPTDNRLDVFPGAGTDAQTVAVQRGGTVSASAYGNPVSFTPEDRPVLAFDADPTTAWRVGAFADVVGERIAIDLESPRPIDHVQLAQADGNRWITRIRLTVGDHHEDVDLTDASHSSPGQTVTFAPVNASHVEIQILATDTGARATYDGFSGVGFREISIPGVRVSESRRLPTDLLGTVGADNLRFPLQLVMSRERVDATAGTRTDPEALLRREVTLPSARSFQISGTARLSSAISPDTLATLTSGASSPHSSASSWLPGDLADRGRYAFDGDPLTWWTPAMAEVRGAWVETTGTAPQSPSHVEVTFAADGRHSVPASVSIMADGREVARAAVPDAPDGPFATTRSIDIALPAGTTGTTWRVVVDDVHERITPEWLGTGSYALPPAIAEVRGITVAATPSRSTIDTGCRNDLLRVNGTPVGVHVTGATADALSGQGLTITGCNAVAVPAGDTTIETVDGRVTGLDLDRLVLSSDASSGVTAPVALGPTTAPLVRVTGQGRDHVTLEVSGIRDDTWLVLGQSFNAGWHASSTELGSLGAPTLIEGYANGWRLEAHDGVLHVTLRWTPQRVVWIGIGVSVFSALVCLGVLTVTGSRRRSRAELRATNLAEPEPSMPPRAPMPWRPAAIAGIAVAIFAVLALPRAPALAALVGIAVAVLLRRGWTLRGAPLVAFGLVSPACLALAGAYTVWQERRGRFRTDFAWPAIFDRVHVLGVLAVVIVAALVVVEVIQRERDGA
jgi:arabinofuranan 3-O-arabinosyltransferase